MIARRWFKTSLRVSQKHVLNIFLSGFKLLSSLLEDSTTSSWLTLGRRWPPSTQPQPWSTTTSTWPSTSYSRWSTPFSKSAFLPNLLKLFTFRSTTISLLALIYTVFKIYVKFLESSHKVTLCNTNIREISVVIIP